ncbi:MULTISPECIES: DMT family transporter [Micrococcaceae]|uniref:Drug/metabolite transporter (DMT)-like permease n=1 Tax=Pseudarthrobacter siccitolerans TaxID=861266 RepID=A0ABU0PNX8_9MICC|nr:MULTISPECIES: DMT family transporter [Micrococcaceae]MDQ0674959.1 drug/metabolite transporter (DMT)-like permease [Pseudarthrobacter siccitolerans]MDQ0693343.1 drug/metabolite transporter (DMT)-like permease [Arthrobacter sp. W4I7]
MAYFIAALGVLGVASSGPLIAATLGATSVSALAIAFWRNAIGAVVMATPTLIREPALFGRVTRREFRWSLLAAVALALHFACFITSLQLTSVAAATALVCLQSAWIAVFQLFRGTRHRWQVLAGLGIAFGGVVAITGFDMGSSPEALAGDLLAVAGGALAGLYTLAGGKARQSMTTGTYTTLCYGMCAALVALLALLGGQPLVGFDAGGWLGIAAITVCAQLVGHTAFNHLLATMGPLLVSMIILLEIPGAALLAAMFLQETLPAGTYAGLALILVGLAVVVLGQKPARAGRRGRPGGSGEQDGPERPLAELGTD